MDNRVEKSILLLVAVFMLAMQHVNARSLVIDNSYGSIIEAGTLDFTFHGGDTIFISSTRVNYLKFCDFEGDENNPIVVTNLGGLVKIDAENAWGAITFENCKYIKISGKGYPKYKYGFELSAKQCGLAFTELSSGCEAEFIHIDHEGFFGIYAKKDYGGYPPSPIPQFDGLSIHDCFIENVTEGMYLGETKTPGMEFRNVEIYNNIVCNTGRESIQIANMVENVKIHNNTLVNAGLLGLYAQNNGLQIGDNSVAHVYNNVIKNVVGFGIISFGSGDNKFENNYIESSQGIFIDNRKVSTTNDSIFVQNNYFYLNNGPFLVKTFNEKHTHIIRSNTYNTKSTDQTNTPSTVEMLVDNNVYFAGLDSCYFQDVKVNNFAINADIDSLYGKLGAPGGYFYQMDNSADNLASFQLLLTPAMITDGVTNGSYYQADFLIDEQNLTETSEVHPSSNSWKPHWNMENGPYHIYFDLGQLYRIDKIMLHDMHGVAPLSISIAQTEQNWDNVIEEPCDKFKTWKKHTLQDTARFIRLTMNSSVYAAVNEIVIYGECIGEQIDLANAQIIDQVDGGSYFSPELLFDEQTKSPCSSMHPTSDSWKPHWNMEKAPYYSILELDGEYLINKIALHDMHNIGEFVVEYGQPGNWDTLCVENCDNFNTWSIHSVDVATSYLRFSMNSSLGASVNEIVLYGSRISDVVYKSQQVNEQRTSVQDELNSSENVLFYPSVVSNYLNIKANLPGNERFSIQIYNLKGQEVFNNTYDSNGSSCERIDVSMLKDGMYLLKYSDNSTTHQVSRFKKVSY